MPSVQTVAVNLLMESARIESEREIPIESLIAAVTAAGYSAESSSVQSNAQNKEPGKARKSGEIRLSQIIVAWAGFLCIMGLMIPGWMGKAMPALGSLGMDAILLLISAIITGYSGSGIIARAISAAKHRTLNMDTLTTLGVGASLLSGLLNIAHELGFFVELESFSAIAGMIITLAITGNGVETWLRRRSVGAVQALLALAPSQATVLRDGKEVVISTEQLAIGDMVLIKPGEKIPSDGIVLEGQSTVDESMITGESLPVDKSADSPLIGATINGQGRLVMKTTKVGKDTCFAQIVRIVEDAQSTKPRIQLLADRITAVFVPIVLAVSTLAFLLWLLFPAAMQSVAAVLGAFWGNDLADNAFALSSAISAAIAVLVIACPCALGLAVPAAISVGVAKASQFGILFKNAEVIERLKRINTIAMDKTGTITVGSPHITQIYALNGDPETLLEDVAIIEQSSEHPLAKAILKYIEEKYPQKVLPQPYKMEAVSGRGIKGAIREDSPELYIGNEAFFASYSFSIGAEMQQAMRTEQNKGATVSLVANQNAMLGFIAFADVIHRDSRAAITTMQKMGMHTAMITGDNRFAAQHIAQQVAVEQILSEQHPDQKYQSVAALQNEGKHVLMVGDGINDAPALIQADVGVAIGSSTDVAIESGDVVLIKGKLLSLVNALRLSHRIYQTIAQNLFWASIYNLVMIPLAIFGIISPVFAEIAMGLSSVTILLNTNRLWFLPKKEH